MFPNRGRNNPKKTLFSPFQIHTHLDLVWRWYRDGIGGNYSDRMTEENVRMWKCENERMEIQG